MQTLGFKQAIQVKEFEQYSTAKSDDIPKIKFYLQLKTFCWTCMLHFGHYLFQN
jgi:hypothetical protein